MSTTAVCPIYQNIDAITMLMQHFSTTYYCGICASFSYFVTPPLFRNVIYDEEEFKLKKIALIFLVALTLFYLLYFLFFYEIMANNKNSNNNNN